jgi:hypothetical protein
MTVENSSETPCRKSNSRDLFLRNAAVKISSCG